jgi:polyhydroxyalkanoate synthesis repressor PhaR
LRRRKRDFAPVRLFAGAKGVSAVARTAGKWGRNVADANGPAPSEGVNAGQAGEQVVIKKYANRRLYNTAASTYVTLDHLSEMVREGVDFIVLDAKTGEDITRSVLTQIIFEQESRGQNLLPVQFLRRLIRFYGDQMQGFLPPYLEMSMESFTKAQEKMRENMSRAFGATTPMAAFEEQATWPSSSRRSRCGRRLQRAPLARRSPACRVCPSRARLPQPMTMRTRTSNSPCCASRWKRCRSSSTPWRAARAELLCDERD